MSRDLVDVVIVGGGAAGCVLARRLAEGGRSVLMVEAGPDLGDRAGGALLDGWRNPRGTDWTTDWGYESEPGGDGSPTKLRRGKLLGGTSWLTRFAVRGHPADFDTWAARGNPGWSFADVLPTFRRLEADADFGTEPWHGDAGPMAVNRYGGQRRSAIHDAAVEALRDIGFPSVVDHNAPGAVGAGPMPMSTQDGRRITTLRAYLQPAPPASTSIHADSQVDRVLIDDGRAHGVRLVDGSEIAADSVILSSGTYGSPPLLMRSGVGPAEHLRELGISVVVDLPGVGEDLATIRGSTSMPASVATHRARRCATRSRRTGAGANHPMARPTSCSGSMSHPRMTGVSTWIRSSSNPSRVGLFACGPLLRTTHRGSCSRASARSATSSV